MKNAAVQNDAIGQWRVTRRLVDAKHGVIATFSGIASITPNLFDETGQMTIQGHSMPAQRRYLLMFSDQIQVARPDGSPFVTVSGEPSQTFLHHCGADLYRGRLFMMDRDSWVEAWHVTGPRKSYRSLSRFRRL